MFNFPKLNYRFCVGLVFIILHNFLAINVYAKSTKNSRISKEESVKRPSSIIALPQILKEILANSNSKKASEYLVEESIEREKSTEKHWLPSLYVDASAFQTNDPARSFTGNLYQRAIRQSDFDPNTINATRTNQYVRTTVGVNLPIYQGGAGQANAKLARNNSIVQKYQLKQTELEQYAYATANYIALVSLKEQKIKLQKIASNINNILKSYALRDQKNQIGYSGYLILEASHNKTKSFIIDNEEKTRALYTRLNAMGFVSANDWQVQDLAIENYLNKYLKTSSQTNVDNNFSYANSALKAEVDVSKNHAEIENAKNLPQLNLFAENYVFNGDRATRNGYSAGVNLRWNFYDPLNFNNHKITSNSVKASRHEYLAHQQQEKSEIEFLEGQIKALNEAVVLGSRNDELMFKNVALSQDLFKNGAINASNLSDAIMKYLDNFVYLANAQMQLIDLHAKKFIKQPINIHDFID